MKKGQARISLHAKKDALVRLLQESMALGDMVLVLREQGVHVSASSLYRYMISDLADEYRKYLWYTGRGLLNSRRVESVGKVASKLKTPVGRDSVGIKISNQKDLNKFISNNR